MDQISSASDDKEAEAESSSSLNSLILSHDCSSCKPKTGDEDGSNKKSPVNSVEIDQTCIRPMNTDDIISKELPSKILDTDFDGNDEDNVTSIVESQSSNLPNSVDQKNGGNENELKQQCKDSEEQFEKQDTGDSSDAAENLKPSCETIEPSFKNVDESSNRVIEEEKDDTCITVTSSNTNFEASPLNQQGSTDTNNDGFVPTIVGIRGAYDSAALNEATTLSNSSEAEVSRKPSNESSQRMNIVNVHGNCANPSQLGDGKPDEVYVVDDERTADENGLKSSCSADLDIKLEPSEPVGNNECMYVGTEHADTCFTSEIFIEEEKTDDNKKEEEEVICIESSGKIPLPIPIKTEALGDCEKQCTVAQSQTTSKERKNDASPTAIRERSLPVVKNATVFSNLGYTCHLCNMTFQEHELLNDHMTLHRNNMVDSKAMNKMKQKMKLTCHICNRQLSTSQSLQQHILIHNDERPHICKTCGKNFRHMSNYKLHLQKHETEKAALIQAKLASERRIAPAPRAIDYGKLIGPFYPTKETVMNFRTKTNLPKTSVTASSSFHRDNAKENANILHRSFTCKSRTGEVSTPGRTGEDLDEVIPLKTFSKVENIVMNAARFIVKVDNIDPNVLKRRIKTPDISIDKNSISSRRIGEKRKIVLEPFDGNKRLKLDQIENIIMDSDSETEQIQVSSTNRDDDQDYDYDNGDDFADSDDDAKSTDAHSQTLSDNQLFEPSNDDRGLENTSKTHNDYVSELRRNAQMILKSEAEKSKNSRPASSSNVIMLKSLSSTKRIPSPTIPDEKNLPHSPVDEPPCESYSSENSDDESYLVNDSFDNAFQRVALRRLLLIQKRAARNNGKIDSKYLLGPLFWRKALRRAKLNTIDFDASTFSDSISSQSPDQIDVSKSTKVDERHTNDPKRLQIRAENKLSCMLDKVRLTDNMKSLNLIGPLFWKRTLQLAGIHYPRDLFTLLDKERLSLQDVEFVGDELSSAKENCANVVTASNRQEKSNLLHTNSGVKEQSNSNSKDGCDSDNQGSKTLGDSILSDVVPLPSSSQSNEVDAVTESSNSNAVVKNSSILYDSLTKPRDDSPKALHNNSVVQSQISTPSSLAAKTRVEDNVREEDTSSNVLNDRLTVVNTTSATVEENSTVAVDGKAENSEISGEAFDGSNTQSMEMNAEADNANIVLNVDENFQLITSNSEKLSEISNGTNYVLVSDETGAMQLVKENDLHLVEGNDVSGDAQYVVNLQGENYTGLELMGQGNGEQLTYALQFDGENYTALQFVQNDVDVEEKIQKSEEGNVSEKSAVIKASEGGESTGYILPSTDLNSIGKELSDFLNLDYGSLMKNENNGT